jgi:hypothetical protein
MATPALVDNISELSAIMKTVFGPGVEQQQNLAAMLYKQFSQSQVRFGGNSYEFPARMVNTQSIGARGYRLSLPEPILNLDVTSRVRHKFVYGTFDIPGPDIEKGKGNVNAFVNTLTDKMRSLTEMVLKDLNMQTYLDGSGVRATSTGVDVAGALPVDQIKYVRVGMHVNVVDATDGATLLAGIPVGDTDPGDTGVFAAKRFTVSAISASTPSVTLASGSPLAPSALVGEDAAGGDFITRHKAIGVELTGLSAIVDDGTVNPAANILQDIDRTTSPLWQAKVLGNLGTPRALTLNLMQIGMDIPEIISGRRVDLVVGSYAARDEYVKLRVPQKRFMDMKLDGGFQMLEYNGRDFLVDVDCQDDTIYFLNRASIQKYGLFDLQFVEQTGGILKHDSLSSGDVFYGYMRAICNLGTTQANANSKIVDLSFDTANYRVAG